MNNLSHFVLCTLFICIFAQTGCGRKPETASKAETKLDAPLRMKLKEITQASTETQVQCLVKLNSTYDEEKNKVLDEIGINVLTDLKEIITVEGKPEAIRKLAGYDFVHSISLSQTRDPLQK